MMRKKNKAGQILRMAAATLASIKSSLGDYYRRMRSQLGGKGAVVATAHKRARILYKRLATQTPYDPQKWGEQSAPFRARQIQKLEKRLEVLKAQNAA